jgi:hypothetical protein
MKMNIGITSIRDAVRMLVGTKFSALTIGKGEYEKILKMFMQEIIPIMQEIKTCR